MSEKQPNVKEFYKEDGTPNKPKVFVASQGHVIACTTDQHMQVADMPIEEYLRKVIQEARVFGDQIFPKYGPAEKSVGSHAALQTLFSDGTNTEKS